MSSRAGGGSDDLTARRSMVALCASSEFYVACHPCQSSIETAKATTVLPRQNDNGLVPALKTDRLLTVSMASMCLDRPGPRMTRKSQIASSVALESELKGRRRKKVRTFRSQITDASRQSPVVFCLAWQASRLDRQPGRLRDLLLVLLRTY
jgi:uncharacterized protein YfaA (DUF2138 family)